MLSMKELLTELDFHLTGKVRANFATPTTAEAWLEDCGTVYLSDGGYSRIYLVPREDRAIFHIVLGSESLDKVKDRWNNVPDLRDLSDTDRAWIQALKARINRLLEDAI